VPSFLFRFFCYYFPFSRSLKSRDNSVGIALGYWLDDRGSRVRFQVGAGNLSLHHRAQNGSGDRPASDWMGTGGSFPGVKRPGREADHSPPYSAEVKNTRSYTSTPQYAFMARWLIKHRDNFTFTLPSCSEDRCRLLGSIVTSLRSITEVHVFWHWPTYTHTLKSPGLMKPYKWGDRGLCLHTGRQQAFRKTQSRGETSYRQLTWYLSRRLNAYS
jgi:hypothetical protein